MVIWGAKHKFSSIGVKRISLFYSQSRPVRLLDATCVRKAAYQNDITLNKMPVYTCKKLGLDFAKPEISGRPLLFINFCKHICKNLDQYYTI